MPLTKMEKPAGTGFLGWLANIFSVDENPVDKGLSGEWKVARELADQLHDRWAVINDLKITLNGKKAQIDHLLLGPWGVFCIETKNWNNAACNSQGQWFRFNRGMWVPQNSPVEQNQAKTTGLTQLLRQINATVKVQTVILFANTGKFDFAQARLPEHTMVFGLPGFIQYLRLLEPKDPSYTDQQVAELSNAIQLPAK